MIGSLNLLDCSLCLHLLTYLIPAAATNNLSRRLFCHSLTGEQKSRCLEGNFYYITVQYIITEHSYLANESFINLFSGGDLTFSPHHAWIATWRCSCRSNGHLSRTKLLSSQPFTSGLRWTRSIQPS